MPDKSKGKRKEKKGKGGSKLKIIPEPLPLHVLTDIYQKIDTLVKQLIHARTIARKKRKEAEFLLEEQESLIRDRAVYREHLNDLLLDVQKGLLDMRTLIDKERESIAKEILKVKAELQKKLESTLKLIDERERTLEELQKSLKELQPLRDLVARTMEKLEELMVEYNRLRIEVIIKSTHLRNQYLNFRADLYNYLYEQLLSLISQVRLYLMPILWDHMEKMSRQNRCHRWDLIQIDEKNAKLLETRNKLLKKAETLDGEEQYYGTEWAFVRLNELRAQSKVEKKRWKNRLKEVFKHRNLTQHYKRKAVVVQEVNPPKVVIDFRNYVQQKLEAIAESQERQEKIERRREIKKKKEIAASQRMPLHQTPAHGSLVPQSTEMDETTDLETTTEFATTQTVSSTATGLYTVESTSEIYIHEDEGPAQSETSLAKVRRSTIKERTSIGDSPGEQERKFSIGRPSTVNIVEHQEEEE